MSNRLRSHNILRRVIGGAVAFALGSSAVLGLRYLNDKERATYEQDQQAAAAVLDPALKDLGGKALGYAMDTKGGGGIKMEKDAEGNYVISFADKDSYQQGAGTVVMGAGSDGRPDPGKTVFAEFHSDSAQHIADFTLVAPEGQKYDKGRGANSGYEGRGGVGVDLDGDGRGDRGAHWDTTEHRTTYGTPAGEQAASVAEAAERELQNLGRGVTPPAAK